MPRSMLSLSKETLAELTSDEMATVVGGAADSDSCTCSIAVICINAVVALCRAVDTQQ